MLRFIGLVYIRRSAFQHSLCGQDMDATLVMNCFGNYSHDLVQCQHFQGVCYLWRLSLPLSCSHLCNVRCSLCSKCFLFSSFNYLFQCSCIRNVFNHEAGYFPKDDGVRSIFLVRRYKYKMISLALRGTLRGLRNGPTAISHNSTKGKTKSCA